MYCGMQSLVVSPTFRTDVVEVCTGSVDVMRRGWVVGFSFQFYIHSL